MKQTAVVIFPGRGTYGKDELGYLARHHADKAAFVKGVDDWRAAQGRETVSDLDNAKTYSAAKHASSINASALIYTCALADFAAIDCEKFDIVAVCGNSLGWYLTLAGAGAVNPANAIRLVDKRVARALPIDLAHLPPRSSLARARPVLRLCLVTSSGLPANALPG